MAGFEIVSPVDMQVIARRGYANEAFIDQAIRAAEDAFPVWAALDIEQRLGLVDRFGAEKEMRPSELRLRALLRNYR